MQPDRTFDAGILLRWSEKNAMLMMMAIFGILADGPLMFAGAMAAASMFGLMVQLRGRWTPAGSLGWANGITLARLAGSLGLLAWPEPSGWGLAGLAVLILCADGLDGWVARRTGMVSAFGEMLDQETDAFFFLCLCLLLHAAGHLGPWVLIPGAFRYLFVLWIYLVKPPARTAARNRFAGTLSVAAILIYALCLTPLSLPCLPLVATAGAALGFSFLLSAWRLYRPPAPA